MNRSRVGLETSFLTYATFGARAGQYAPAPGRTSLSVLKALRAEAEALLKTRYWGAKVDCSGGKCIALSEGAFQRPVDVVPSHWFDTIDYQTSGASHDRGVVILDKVTSSGSTVAMSPSWAGSRRQSAC